MYKTYSVSDLKVEDDSRIIHGEVGVLRYALVFNPDYSSSPDFGFRCGHISFYALTHGWDKYTMAGYKSHFFNYGVDCQKCDNDILKMFDAMLRCSSFDHRAAMQGDLFDGA